MDMNIGGEAVVRRPWYTSLYVQVLTAIVAGVLLGHFAPTTGEALKPIGDGFIKLVKMIIAPVIFLTIVTGIAGMRDLAAVGRVAANEAKRSGVPADASSRTSTPCVGSSMKKSK